MALWDSITLKTNLAAQVFNQATTTEIVPMAVKGNASLYYLFGETQMGEFVTAGLPRVKRHSEITGNNIQRTMMGSVASPDYITSVSDELTAATITHDPDITGTVEFALAHLGLTYPVPDSEYDRLRGKERHTVDWMTTLAKYLKEGYMKKLSEEFHEDSTSAGPSISQFGSWVTTVDSNNTYLLLDRSVSDNADFRSYENTAFGAFNYPDLMAQVINQGTTYNANVNVGITHPTIYNAVLNYANSMSLITNPGDHVAFGAKTATIGGIKWISDQNCPSDAIALLDSDWWELWFNDTRPFADPERFLITNPATKASRIILTGIWTQNFCSKPANQLKFRGVTV